MSVRMCLACALALSLAACAAQPAMAPDPAPPAPPAMGAVTTPAGFREVCAAWDDWDKPAPPFRIMGQTWYVGTCGISAILIATPDGHFLIDSGTAAGADTVIANIRAAGFDPADVRYILHSHEHFDHVGGHARLAEVTGAQVVSSVPARAVLESGTVSADDPQAGSGHPAMAPVAVAQTVVDGDTLTLGETSLTAMATPGHSPGALSWRWWACSLPGEPPVCRTVVYADSLSAVSADSYRFSDHPEYVARFRASLERIRDLYPCDILVTPHPTASGPDWPVEESAYGEPTACRDYASGALQRLVDRLGTEAQ